jgi:anti-sigma B factor antagonist
MSDERPPDDRVLVALQPPCAFIRITGRASFKVGTALKQFGQGALDAGAQTMAFDMADCSGMDSTFMGVLAGMALRLRKAGGVMVLFNLNGRTRGLVATLGLDQIVEAHEAGSLPPSLQDLADRSLKLRALATGPESKHSTARTMLEAHENLVQVDAANQPRFKDVLTFLREDLKNLGAKAPDVRGNT